mgnify:CR=1 FL=1
MNKFFQAVTTCITISMLSFAAFGQSGAPHDHDKSHDHDHKKGDSGKSFEVVHVPKSESAPALIRLASGVTIVADIENPDELVGVTTHEGIFGPLLYGSELRAFYILLKPGQFLAEHPHPTESMVYTVSGKWVLVSEGNRRVMKPGTLFHFADNAPTGWEAPFNEDALLLVVKSSDPDDNYESMIEGVNNMAAMIDRQMKEEDVAFWYDQIPSDHPARRFARKVNPNFDEILEMLKSGKVVR